MNKKDVGGGGLHITFHNPNSTEDTVKYLTKLIASDLAAQAARGLPCASISRPDKPTVSKKSARER